MEKKEEPFYDKPSAINSDLVSEPGTEVAKGFWNFLRQNYKRTPWARQKKFYDSKKTLGLYRNIIF